MSAVPVSQAGPEPLVDRFGRTVTDLRVSLTDRCNLRCTYCMPSEGLDWRPAPEQLTTAEVVRLVGIATEMGISEVRITGGEPLVRPDVVAVVAGLAGLPRAPALSMTTNGLRLGRLAAPLARAGLLRINISLDTLNPATFAAITQRAGHEKVLAGIRAAQAAGLTPVKCNAVLIRGVNDAEAPALLRWALAEGVQLRFIEAMPLDPQHRWNRETLVTRAEILDRLAAAGFSFCPAPGRGSAPAEEFLVDGGPATFGIVGSVTAAFCSACDRARLTADGYWRSCLFAHTETDLAAMLRTGGTDAEIAAAIRSDVAGKQSGHGIGSSQFRQPDRPMSAIGG